MHDPTTDYVLDLWRRGLPAVDSGDLSLVDRELDWVIKCKLLDRYARSTACRGVRPGSPSST